jgi:hypothetical protein
MEQSEARPFLGVATISFLLLLTSLAWMKAPLNIRGLDAFPMDLLFIAAICSWGVALIRGGTSLRWHRGYLFLAAYSRRSQSRRSSRQIRSGAHSSC